MRRLGCEPIKIIPTRIIQNLNLQFCCILMSSLLGSKIIELSCWICFSILPIESVYYILARPWNKFRVTIRSEVCISKLHQKHLSLHFLLIFCTKLHHFCTDSTKIGRTLARHILYLLNLIIVCFKNFNTFFYIIR